jgi:hypothetical protein
MKPLRFLGVLMLLTSLSACDEMITALAQPATLTVVNQTRTPVYFLYISACTSSSWGPDRLGSNEVIGSGATRRWTLDPGCYDVRAEFSDNGYAETTTTLMAGQEHTLRLTP